MKLDYISILAGGACKIDCSFCVGRSIRTNEDPHFANRHQINSFLETYERLTDKLSVSGSTSDPTFCFDLDYIIERTIKLSVKLHTCNMQWLLDNEWIFDKINGVVASIHSVPFDDVLSMVARHKNVRVSTVYTWSNMKQIDSGEFFGKIPVDIFTVRKNVFEPMTPKWNVDQFGEIFNQPMFLINDKKVVLWDFPDANQYQCQISLARRKD